MALTLRQATPRCAATHLIRGAIGLLTVPMPLWTTDPLTVALLPTRARTAVTGALMGSTLTNLERRSQLPITQIMLLLF